MFGDNLGCVENGTHNEWAKLVVDFFYMAQVVHQCYKFWPLNKLLAALIPPSTKLVKERHHEASLQRMRRRIAMKTERHDFAHYFLPQAEKEGLSKPVVEAQGSIVVLGASDSTATALTAAVYHITKDREVYRRLCEEVRGAFTKSEEITLQKVKHDPKR